MTFIEDPVVVLTEEEMDFADLIGRRREGQHDKDEPHKHGFVGDGL